MSKPWTEAHKREGRARALELFAALARGGGYLDKLDEEVEGAGFERAWRPRSLLSYALRLDAKAMRRERKRIDALAEGRLVRESGERFEVVFMPEGTRVARSTWGLARADAQQWREGDRKTYAVRTTVTRIRRAAR